MQEDIHGPQPTNGSHGLQLGQQRKSRSEARRVASPPLSETNVETNAQCS